MTMTRKTFVTSTAPRDRATEEVKRAVVDRVRNGESYMRAAALEGISYNKARDICIAAGVLTKRTRGRPAGSRTAKYDRKIPKAKHGENERLLALWHAGDEDAFTLLFELNAGLRGRAIEMYGRGFDPIEQESIANAGFLESARRFRPDAGTVFTTYCMFVTSTHFTRRRAYEAAEMRNPQGCVYSMTEHNRPRWEGLLDRGAENPAKLVADKDHFQHMMRRVHRRMRRLNVRERDMVWRSMKGQSLREISEHHGVHSERVRQLVIRSLKWLRMSQREFAKIKKANKRFTDPEHANR